MLRRPFESALYTALGSEFEAHRTVKHSDGEYARYEDGALVMAIWRRGKPDALLHHSDQGSQGGFKRSSQHDVCWPIEATGQAPLRVFST